ncbi:MAG: mechanosensitive ion channel [Alphaproteobacteria bacterium]
MNRAPISTRSAASRLAGWLVAIALVFSAGFAAAQDAGDAKPASTIDVKSDADTDASIALRLGGIYDALSAFRGVEIEVDAGVVSLSGTVADSASVEEAAELAQRVQGVVAVRNDIAVDASLGDQLTPAYERLTERLQLMVGLLPLIAVALIVFVVFLIVGLWAARSWALWDRIAPNAFVGDLIRQIVRIAFIVGGAVVALDILSATALLGTLLGTAGLVGLAVGFAVRDTIENYIASILLSIRQPFRPNDHVRIEGFEGHVIRLTSRATIIMTLDGNHVRIPNATVFKGVVENFSANPERRFEFVLGIDADASLRDALDLGLATLDQIDFVLKEPEPVGLVQDVGDSNVLLWFSGWIDQRATDFGKARGESIRLTKRALENAGFGLPEPIYRLRMEGTPATLSTTPPARPTAPEPPADSAEAGDASIENAVAEKVAEERARGGEDDLLDPTRPTE